MMQPLIPCQRGSRVPMCFGPPTGLRVQHSTTSGQASILLLQTHPILLLCHPLLMTTTALENPLQSSSPVVAPHSFLLPSWPPVVQNINNLLICLLILYLPLSVSDADVSSSHGQTGTSSKWHKVNGPVSLLSTSDKLKNFISTIKDFLKSKEVNKRQ